MQAQQLYRTTLFVFLCATVLVGYTSISYAETAHQGHANTVKECKLKIEGMTCSMCEAMIKKSLKGPILSAEIDSKAGTGRVTYVEGKTTCAAVSKKITEAGFKSTITE